MKLTHETIAAALSLTARLFEQVAKTQGAKFVFLGGAAVPLYQDIISFAGFAMTKDIDILASVISPSSKAELEKAFSQVGLVRDGDSGKTSQEQALPFRWWHENRIQIDLLSTDLDWGGNHNRWFRSAWENAIRVSLPTGEAVWLAYPPAYIACKLDAFHARGSENIFRSKDLHDLLKVIAGRSALKAETATADIKLRNFVASSLHILSRNSDFDYLLSELSVSLQVPPDLLKSRVSQLIRLA